MSPANSHNVIAAFDDSLRAQRAAQQLSRRGVSHVRLVAVGEGADRARAGELRAEMQEEVSDAVAGPAIGLMTPDQAKGAFPGAIVGGAIGLLFGLAVGFLWANIATSPISQVGRILIGGLAFMVAGGTIGFIAGGALKPRYESKLHPSGTLDEKRMAAEGRILVAVEAVNEQEADVAHEVLEDAGATRVDDVDRDGRPLPPQAEHPRPADPPNWWSNGGRHKG